LDFLSHNRISYLTVEFSCINKDFLSQGRNSYLQVDQKIGEKMMRTGVLFLVPFTQVTNDLIRVNIYLPHLATGHGPTNTNIHLTPYPELQRFKRMK
jgi:hypothetical protein